MYLRRITDDEYSNLEVYHRKDISELISRTSRFKQGKCALNYVKNDIYLESDEPEIIYIITNYSLIRAPLEYSIRYNCMDEISSWCGFEEHYKTLINREQLARKLSLFLGNGLFVLDITNYIIDIVILTSESL
jgi:hypothetical protein